MNYVQIVLLAIIFLVFGCLVIAITLAVRNSLKNGLVTRSRLAGRLKQLPYRRMLARRNIDMDIYLAKILVRDIRTQLGNCEGCKAIVKCEDVLNGDDDSRQQDYSFCPNDCFFRDSGAKGLIAC